MTFDDPTETGSKAQRNLVAHELELAVQDLDALLERTRIAERMAIAYWLIQKAQTIPVEQRLLYRLIADDIHKGVYCQ